MKTKLGMKTLLILDGQFTGFHCELDVQYILMVCVNLNMPLDISGGMLLAAWYISTASV